MRVIYDLGANSGKNLTYFLLKADRVVAVEANPDLCTQLQELFEDEIKCGRLVIENAIITKERFNGKKVFYVNKNSHLLSQFPKPEKAEEFYEIDVPTISITELIKRYGPPFYIKIDIEYYDAEVLESLFFGKIYPPYLSAEAQTLKVLGLFIGASPYVAYKLVDGLSTSQVSRRLNINTNSGEMIFNFPPESSGPFGEDLGSNWLTANQLMLLLMFSGLGWKDIHASLYHKPNGGRLEMMRYGRDFWLDRLLRIVKAITPRPLRSLLYTQRK